MSAKHTLSLTFRGGQHIHKYAPSCSCGWIGIPLRKGAALKEWRRHLLAQESINHRASNGKTKEFQPERLTPRDKLPEALR